MKRLIAVVVMLAFAGALNAGASPVQTFASKLQWRSIGPYIGGRVVAATGVPSEPDVFYMGAVQGGIWKSTDYGNTWTNISDGKLPRTAYSIGALAVAESNPKIIYAGTGESDIRQDFATGTGMYKSTDGGEHWQYSGLSETHQISSIVVDPHDANIVYATSMGHVFAANAERGVFKSTDGGKSWRKVLFVDDRTGGNVIVMDRHNPRVLYSAMWEAVRHPWGLTSGGLGSGLYKSVDAGEHWTKLSTNPGFAKGILGKIGVSVSGADSRVVYVIAQAKNGGVFRSNDGGATWTHVNDEMKLRQRAFYYSAVYADPVSVNVAYAPEVDSVFKTSDGGRTWHPLTGGGDHHIVWINPHNPKILLEGDDGGATISVDGGKTWSTENNQPTGQFYHIALDNQFPYHVYGAQQDEGAYEGPSASSEGLNLGAWHIVAYGESTFVAPDPDDANVTYGSGYYSDLIRLNTPYGDLQNVTPWPFYKSGSESAQQAYRFGWTHPVFFSPGNPHVFYTAAQVVFRSTDKGQTWTAISPDLTRNDPSTEGPSGGPVDYDQTGAEIFPDIASLAVSPLDENVLWAGSADGLVHMTADGGKNWQRVTPPQLTQWAQISSIEPSHTERGTAYLTASRYMWDDFHPYVFETTDFGAHWSPISRGLPQDEYVHVIRQDPREPRLLFAGTRSSVYVSTDGARSWQPLTLNLPGVQVRDIAIDARQGQVAIATHGRAFWILDNLKLLEDLASNGTRAASDANLFPPETAWLSHAYGGGGGQGATGTNPAYGVSVFFSVPNDYNGKTPVSLTFSDTTGKTIRHFELHLRDKRRKPPSDEELTGMDHRSQLANALQDLTTIDPGMNLFQWDMRFPPATEVQGFHLPTTDDFDDGVNGPTILPGTYTVTLQYGGKRVAQTFAVALDPRFHPASDALAQRLALASSLHATLDALNGTINAAMNARNALPAAKRAQVDGLLAEAVQMQIRSSEGDTLHPVALRDYIAFLMNQLDTSYNAPTKAQADIAADLQARAASLMDRLRSASDGR